jgi:hypothetical protein
MGERGRSPAEGAILLWHFSNDEQQRPKSALIQSLNDQSGNNPATSPKVNVSLSNLRDVEGEIPMRTILLGGLTAVGLALAATSGASAQYYNYGYNNGYGNYGYGYRYGYRPYSYGYNYGYRPYGYGYRRYGGYSRYY